MPVSDVEFAGSSSLEWGQDTLPPYLKTASMDSIPKYFYPGLPANISVEPQKSAPGNVAKRAVSQGSVW